jgi:hypothetical protein
MTKRITKTLRLRRNISEALAELHQRHSSVATDSVFGTDPGQSLLSFISGSMVGREFVANLQWEVRQSWAMQIPDNVSDRISSFNVYGPTSHKYWLRGLIRRCR